MRNTAGGALLAEFISWLHYNKLDSGKVPIKDTPVEKMLMWQKINNLRVSIFHYIPAPLL